ncbi:MAG: hypothetical protein KF887_03025 [Paracoccaceae bacterium]|nr:MAG: hypothetical protein KF887_03025 [Paracoccaceae bacterium]
MILPPAVTPTRPHLSARQVAARRRFVGELQKRNIEAETRANRKLASPSDPLRGRAHAAFYEVVTPGELALDAALDVYAAEIDSLRVKVADLTEVLKLIRSYSCEQWLRNLSAATLTAGPGDLRQHFPGTLFDPEVATAADTEWPQ